MKKKVISFLVGGIILLSVSASAATSSWSINQISGSGRPPIGVSRQYWTGGGTLKGSTTSQRALTDVSYSIKIDVIGAPDKQIGTSWNGIGSGGNVSTTGNVYIQAIGYATASKIDSSGSITH